MRRHATRYEKTASALALTLALALGAPAAAATAEKQPEEAVPAGGKCEFSIAKKTFRLSPVIARGVPVRVSCDGPAGVMAMMSWKFGSPQRDKWNLQHPGGIPGITTGPPLRMWEPRTVTIRSRLAKDAARFIRQFERTTLSLSFGVERADKPNVFRHAGHRWIVLVRD